ncbi:MAG: VCBS domain-containing protein, partial [Cyanobium sp. LacPavin_0920_WC12_MAG_62_9]|nr:VCBS domain-containing protein [Cyanobium sp. LacPavin_0920_WC12_MAG_62_9]
YASKHPSGEPTILVNAEWFSTASAEQRQRLLLQEIGHALDDRLNGGVIDSRGDEGAFFAQLVTATDPKTIKAATFNYIDTYTLQIDGKQVSVEGSNAIRLQLEQGIAGTWQWLKERSGRADFKGLAGQAFGPAKASKAWDSNLTGVLGGLASGKGLSGLRFELVDGQTLKGLQGAYASKHPSGEPTILVNAEWFSTASAEQRQRLLLQEIGHALDDRLNGGVIDSRGDEGAFFAQLVTATDPKTIKAATFNYSDHYTLQIDGKQVAVEASVNNANPTATFSANQIATEGGSLLAGTLTATDADANATITYSLLGDTIPGFTLINDSWSFNPADAAYDDLAEGEILDVSVVYRATDQYGLYSDQTFTITVTGTNDAPTVSAASPTATLVEAGGTTNGIPGVASASITLSKGDVDGGAEFVPIIDLGSLGKLIAPVQVEGKRYYHWDRNSDGTIGGDSYNRDQGTFRLSEIYSLFKEDIDGNIGSATNDTYRYATINGVRLALPTLGTSPTYRLMDGTALADPNLTNSSYNDLSAIWDSHNGNLSGSYTGQGLNGGNRGSGNVTSGAPLTWFNDTYVSATPWPSSSDYASLRLYDGLVLSHDNWAMNVALEVLSTTIYDTAYLTSQGWTSSGSGDYIKSGSYGNATFSLNNGVVTYTLDNSANATQSLTAGQSASDSFGSIQVTDGSATTLSNALVFSITGSNDVPVVANAALAREGTVVEAGHLDNGTASAGTTSVSGTLAASDVDSGATRTWSIAGTPSTTYGAIAINSSTGVWTYALDNTKAATQALKEGQSVNETFTARVTDDFGAYVDQTITVSVNGTNDVPTVTNSATALSGSVTEAGHLDNGTVVAGTGSVTGTLSASDVDTGATRSWSISGNPSTNYGANDINASTGVLTYTLDNTNTATQALKEGQSVNEVFTARVTDDFGAYVDQTITVSVNGTNDVPTVTNNAAALSGSVTEAGNLDNGTTFAGTSSISGTLGATDVDGSATRTWIITGTPSTTYGAIAINASTGVWTYTLDNTLSATQALKEGQSVTQSYTARVTDDFGAYVDQTITVTISGTNDLPTVSNSAAALSGSVIEAGHLDNGTASAGTTTVSGTLAVSDVDTGATRTWSIAGSPAVLTASTGGLWATSAGGTGDDYSTDITALADGSALITGYFNGSATFGSTTLTSAGSTDVFIAKLNADGTYAWATKAGGSGAEKGNGITALSDGSSLITGNFNGSASFGSTTLTSSGQDVFVAKLNADGSFAWATKAGGSGTDYGLGITALSDGSSLVTGSFNGSASFGSISLTGAGSDDAFVAKLNPNGSFAWATKAGGTGQDF